MTATRKILTAVGALVILALGALASVICYMAIIVKNKLGYDDSLDAFGVHGIGGIVGAIFLTFFIRESWMTEAAAAAGGSWTVWQQLGVQIAAVLVAIVYAAVITLILLVVISKTIGLKAPDEAEMHGLDSSYHGEHGYGMLNL